MVGMSEPFQRTFCKKAPHGQKLGMKCVDCFKKCWDLRKYWNFKVLVQLLHVSFKFQQFQRICPKQQWDELDDFKISTKIF